MGHPTLRGTGLAGGRAVAAVFCLAKRLGGFFRSDQWGSLNGLTGSSGGECHGNGSGADIVGQINNHDDIVVSEGEPGGFNFASQFLDRGTRGFDSVLRIRYQRFPALLGIRDLLKVMWHRASFRFGNWGRMIPEDGLEVKPRLARGGRNGRRAIMRRRWPVRCR